MPIKEAHLKHWVDNFYGYGSWQARMWFIAHEEGGGDLPEEVSEKVGYFYETSPHETKSTLCDIRALYRRVTFRVEGPRAESFANLYEYRFGSSAKPHGVWKNLIAFEAGYRQEEVPDVLAYQKNSFASPSSSVEALIRLYPLPSPHNHAWYYSWLDMPQLPFLKSRALYQEELYEVRIKRILENINIYKPELVLMYGMENINRLKGSVQEFFPTAEFKMVKALKQQIPQHHIAECNGTVMVITTQIPALRHNRVESGFDWKGFGAAITPPPTCASLC